ncbi:MULTISPECIES: hypothetical protein [unclassified Microcoleus]
MSRSTFMRPTLQMLTSRTDDRFVDIHITGLLNGIGNRPGDRKAA